MRQPFKYPRKPIPDIENPYGYIYIIRNLLTLKPYIGQKCSPVVVESYWGSSETLNDDIKKLGIKNFSREILDWAASKEELNKKEIYWIENINTFHGFGYNKSCGGDGLGSGKDHPCYGHHYNLGELNPFYGKGIEMTSEVKTKMSIAKQNCFGEKNNFYGHKHTDEWKQKYRNGENNPRSKSVYQYTLDYKLVKTYPYLKAVKFDGFNPDSVSKRCLGKTKSKDYKGFYWSYTPLT